MFNFIQWITGNKKGEEGEEVVDADDVLDTSDPMNYDEALLNSEITTNPVNLLEWEEDGSLRVRRKESLFTSSVLLLTGSIAAVFDLFFMSLRFETPSL